MTPLPSTARSLRRLFRICLPSLRLACAAPRDDTLRVHLSRLAPRLPLAAAGGVPVTLIAGSAFGLDLRALALLVLVPVLFGVAARMLVHTPTRALVSRAVAAGVVATGFYDLCRGAFLWSGLMDHDPIPHIGTALGLDPAWLTGYAWRYLGNGTGLALTFLVLGLRGTRVGIAYGLAVCSCLLLTLVISPFGTQILFPLNVTTIVMATIGHAIYGAALGTLAARPPAQLSYRPSPIVRQRRGARFASSPHHTRDPRGHDRWRSTSSRSAGPTTPPQRTPSAGDGAPTPGRDSSQP